MLLLIEEQEHFLRKKSRTLLSLTIYDLRHFSQFRPNVRKALLMMGGGRGRRARLCTSIPKVEMHCTTNSMTIPYCFHSL